MERFTQAGKPGLDMSADAFWPPSLPQAPLLSAYNERYSSTVTSVTTGNKSLLIRKNSSRAQDRLEVAFIVTRKQVEIFKTFFNDTLDGGSRRFYFEHPRTLEDVECSFDPTTDAPFTITPADNITMEYFKITATFIVWN